jgi:Family of unknown function (DUF6516)
LADIVSRKPATKAVKREKRVDETLHLSGKRRGAILKEEVWYEADRLVKYSLAYINPRICAVDNGRVLGYDNTHQYHHRHFRGKTEEIEFSNYPALLARFERELHQLWKEEDE